MSDYAAGTTDRPPSRLEHEEQIINFIRTLIAKSCASREALSVPLPAGGELVQREARKIERKFLIQYGEANGALLLAKGIGLVSDAAHDALKREILESVMPRIVGPTIFVGPSAP